MSWFTMQHCAIPSDLAGQVRRWNATDTDYPRDKAVAQVFEEIVTAYPDSVALVCGGRQVTYSELNDRANQMAHRLRSSGVGPEVMVGCCMERSIELIVALIAILKAGGAYVPLDPAYPRDRLSFLLQDTNTPIILTQKSIASSVLADHQDRCVIVDAPEASNAAANEPQRPSAAGPKTLAYVMYTSGSTGRPKGVMVENRAIIRLVRNTDFCRFGPDEIFLQFAPISFDASTLEIWGPLLNGGRLVIMPPGASPLDELGRVIREQNITTLWLTAGLFSLVVQESLDTLRPIRQLLAGGDVLSPRHVRRVLDAFPDCRVINGYGPTENTTFTCCHAMRAGEPVPEPIPVGRPIANTRAYVLDEQLRHVPPGEVGELYAAGDGVARGYLNNPQTTEQRFLPDPFLPGTDARMYRTGDLARWRSDGVVEFLGRSDRQVKILGHRIEPGEIESTLEAHVGIKQSCVVCSEGDDGSKRLVGYYVSGDPTLSTSTVRAFLAERLPPYMVPTVLVPVSELPLTPNGKVDREALPAPDAAAAPQTDVAAVGGIEQAIIDIWKKHIGNRPIGIDENFFEIGGDSLRLMGVHNSLQGHFREQIPITVLFEHTTVQSLARYLSGHLSNEPVFSREERRADLQRAAFARHRARRTGAA